MNADRARVCLYIFAAEDGLCTDDKIRLAAQKYVSDGTVTDGAVICRTPKGKPYFRDLPQIHVSPSHSGAYFVCAVADFPVGADIQLHRNLHRDTPEESALGRKRIAGRFFSEKEAAFLEADTGSRFFAVWTARESYVKFTGQGIDGTFKTLCVLPDGGALPLPEEPDGVAAWQALGAEFRQLRLQREYTLCVCAGEAFSVELHWLTEKQPMVQK